MTFYQLFMVRHKSSEPGLITFRLKVFLVSNMWYWKNSSQNTQCEEVAYGEGTKPLWKVQGRSSFQLDWMRRPGWTRQTCTQSPFQTFVNPFVHFPSWSLLAITDSSRVLEYKKADIISSNFFIWQTEDPRSREIHDSPKVLNFSIPLRVEKHKKQ